MEPLPPPLTRRPDATVVANESVVLVRVPAPAGLDGLVTDLTLYRERSCVVTRQVEAASLIVPLIIGFDQPFEIAIGREPTSGDAYGSFGSGLSLRPVNIASFGHSSCLQINFTPLGARRFFGLPMHLLTEQMIRLDEFEDPALPRLRQQLGEEPDWDRRFEVAENLLLERLRNTPAASPAVAWAYGRILSSHGRAAVEPLAEEVQWSRKHLAARFKDEIGLPPKQVARIARFLHATSLAISGAGSGWADVAAACGYSDQAHLTREFRELSGTAPSRWLDFSLR